MATPEPGGVAMPCAEPFSALNHGQTMRLGSDVPVPESDDDSGVKAPKKVTTIMSAIEAVSSGGVVVVPPGVYNETLVIEKDVEIFGEGGFGEVILQSRGIHTVSILSGEVKLTNLTLRQHGQGQWFCVNVCGKAQATLSGCNVSCDSLSCVGASERAKVTLNACCVHSSKNGSGVILLEHSKGVVNNCFLYNNKTYGVEVCERASAVVDECRVYENLHCGILINGAAGIFRKNTIHKNKHHGISLTDGATPTITDNDISHHSECGVVVEGPGQGGELKSNTIYKNRMHGIEIRNTLARRTSVLLAVAPSPMTPMTPMTPGSPGSPGASGTTSNTPPTITLTSNRISYNLEYGVCVRHGCAATVRANELKGNAYGALYIEPSEGVRLEENRLLELAWPPPPPKDPRDAVPKFSFGGLKK